MLANKFSPNNNFSTYIPLRDFFYIISPFNGRPSMQVANNRGVEIQISTELLIFSTVE